MRIGIVADHGEFELKGQLTAASRLTVTRWRTSVPTSCFREVLDEFTRAYSHCQGAGRRRQGPAGDG